jgi:hypothetical protein
MSIDNSFGAGALKRFIAWLLGVACASFASAALLVVLGLVRSWANAGAVFGAFPLFFAFSVLAALALGTPVLLLLQRLRAVTWWSAPLAGSGIGLVVATSIRFPGTPPLTELLVFGAIGAISAVGFWVVWKVIQQAS